MDIYLTKDLSEAAFLYASGVKFLRLEPNSNDRPFTYFFVFENKAKCEELSQEFWNKKAVINAKEYADAMRTLKDLLFKNR